MDRLALGRYLRESREAREATLEEAVTASRIRRSVLERFEQGDFEVGDSPVQVRGLLRSYARYLNLDEDTVLQYYEAARQYEQENRRRGKKGRRSRNKRSTQERIAARRSITDTQPTPPVLTTLADQRTERKKRRRSLLNTVATLLVVVASLTVIAYVGLDMTGALDELRAALAPSPTSAAVVAVGDPTPTNTPSWTPQPIPASATDAPGSASFLGQGVQVIIEMLQRSWVRVTVDDEVRYTGVMAPGDFVQYDAAQFVAVDASNAAALRVTYNGEEQAIYGDRSQAVSLLFRPDGIDVETSEGIATDIPPTPTVSPTETPSPTSIPTETPLAAELRDVPTLTPLFADADAAPVEPGPTATDAPAVEAAAGDSGSAGSSNIEVPGSPTPVQSAESAAIPAPSLTPSVPPATATPSPTGTPSPTANAVLPPRNTPSDLPTAKPIN